MNPPGLRLRQAREKLGLTYRDVERASYEIASKRGRQEFVLHISRLADIENHNVVPSLHKVYTLATVYQMNPLDITSWYEAPFQLTFHDGVSFPPPNTHLGDSVPELKACKEKGRTDQHRETEFLQELPDGVQEIPGLERKLMGCRRYGRIGMDDRRMVPILKPGSIVVVDTSLRKIQDAEWTNEYDRPLYFVELRDGYRCGWFRKEKSRLMMQPHMLSRCSPEVWPTPDEAEVVGQVVGVVTYLNAPWSFRPPGVAAERQDSSRTAP